ncbi:MAG: hypothetical protein HXX11_09725 [Desulfuromonadales bacterium]|nr:hypothetical protein [Desulfuromonadales bacterium]
MRYPVLLLITLFQLVGSRAYGQDVSRLADCGTKIFKDINRTGKWSGKPPSSCAVKASVEKRPSGIFVTTWSVEEAEGGWIRTAFTGAMSYGEVAGKKALARAGKDIAVRARHLERCLNSITKVNDPLDCRDNAIKSYVVDEESGTETKRLVWLDDEGRHTVVEYAFGTTSSTPAPPVDLFSGQQLPPGTIINLRIRP